MPGTIEAEDFDEGGEGVAYHDSDDDNQGGEYRPDEGVDIEEASEGGFNVGWLEDGEWLEYTVDVESAGTYDMLLRVASSTDNPGTITVSMAGDQLGTVEISDTGGWQNWDTIQLSGVDIRAGEQILRLDIGGGDFNLNWFAFIIADTEAPTAPANLSSPGRTSSSVDLEWDSSTDNVGMNHYNVYVDGTQWTESTVVTETVSGLNSNTTYDFLVTAEDAAGNESDPSNTVSVTTDVNSGTEVGIYRVFEAEVTNVTGYSNPFKDVELQTTFTAPSGASYDFWGFYDGDGSGGQYGDIWKFRFLPDELGTWTFSWSFSDGSSSGSGTFDCVSSGGAPGVLHPYEWNHHWWAYNKSPLSSGTGSEPVFLRSYYVHAHASILQDIDWMGPNVYQPLIDAGHNHLQLSGMLPVAHINNDQVFSEGPDPINKLLYSNSGDPTTMNLDVWHELERHMDYLNDRDIGVQMFQGFQGKASSGDQVLWEDMDTEEKEWYVKYTLARIGPYANMTGYNFTFEEYDGEGTSPHELATLLEQNDLWSHGRTYHHRHNDIDTDFDLPPYRFGAVENHGDGDSSLPFSHHRAMTNAYEGKPVWMMEGNGLWRSFWGASEDNVIDNIWAVVTGGGSFCWNALEGDAPHTIDDLLAYPDAIAAMDAQQEVMTQDLDWQRMVPHQELLSNHENSGDHRTFCLAEPGEQYLVIEYGGGTFDLNLASGTYSGFWMDTHTGDRTTVSEFTSGGGDRTFLTPTSADQVLILTVD